MKRICILLVLLVSILFSQASTYIPQRPDTRPDTIEIINDRDIVRSFVEGEDFASIQLRNAWDMSQKNDVGFWVNINNVISTDGIWQGKTSGIPYFFPLFQGFSTPVGNNLSQELIWNKVGADQKYAIDPQKYDLLSYRIYVEKPSQFFVRWTSSSPVDWPKDANDVDGRFGSNDGCYTQTEVKYWPAGWRTYFFDLSQPNGDAIVRMNNWKDFTLIRGIRIDPSASIADSQTIKIDWIRLTSSQRSHVIPIKWSGEFSTTDKVDIWVTTNPANNQDVMPLVRSISALDKEYTLFTSIFPPGLYYFKLKLMDGASPYNGCGKVKAESDWVGPMTIEPAPVIEFVSPSALSGEDYARVVVGNPWDMVDQADIITPTINYPTTISAAEFSGGIFCANAGIIPGQSMSDSQIWLNTNGGANNYSDLKPIDTKKYRYFSVRLKVDLPKDKDINWAVRTGWGSRLVWWNWGIQTDGSETKYGFLMDGWNIYTIDLYKTYLPASLNNQNQGENILTPKEQNPYPAQKGWKELTDVKFLRFDPLETLPEAINTGSDRFCIDWFLLTGENKVKRGELFDIKYQNSQEDWDVTLYFTSDPALNPTPEGQKISNAQAPSDPLLRNLTFLPLITKNYGGDVFPSYSQIIRWNTENVSAGAYYICAKTVKFSSERTFCSEYPVVIEEP